MSTDPETADECASQTKRPRKSVPEEPCPEIAPLPAFSQESVRRPQVKSDVTVVIKQLKADGQVCP